VNFAWSRLRLREPLPGCGNVRDLIAGGVDANHAGDGHGGGSTDRIEDDRDGITSKVELARPIVRDRDPGAVRGPDRPMPRILPVEDAQYLAGTVGDDDQRPGAGPRSEVRKARSVRRPDAIVASKDGIDGALARIVEPDDELGEVGGLVASSEEEECAVRVPGGRPEVDVLVGPLADLPGILSVSINDPDVLGEWVLADDQGQVLTIP
jgi:hypothetical protein